MFTASNLLKNPKLNLRKLVRFSPFGIDLKYMIGNRIKFQIKHTTHAFVIETNRMDDPNVANFVAKNA